MMAIAKRRKTDSPRSMRGQDTTSAHPVEDAAAAISRAVEQLDEVDEKLTKHSSNEKPNLSELLVQSLTATNELQHTLKVLPSQLPTDIREKVAAVVAELDERLAAAGKQLRQYKSSGDTAAYAAVIRDCHVCAIRAIDRLCAFRPDLPPDDETIRQLCRHVCTAIDLETTYVQHAGRWLDSFEAIDNLARLELAAVSLLEDLCPSGQVVAFDRLSPDDAMALAAKVLLVAWLPADPKADERTPHVTNLQKWAWGGSVGITDLHFYRNIEDSVPRSVAWTLLYCDDQGQPDPRGSWIKLVKAALRVFRCSTSAEAPAAAGALIERLADGSNQAVRQGRTAAISHGGRGPVPHADTLRQVLPVIEKLGGLPDGRWVPKRQIAKEIGYKVDALSRPMSAAVHHGILSSKVGPAGGFRFTAPGLSILRTPEG